jgi:sulfite exporter TauE/SafE
MVMNSTLALTALLMGLAGGPHCLAMCGAVCAGIGRSAQKQGAGQGTSAMLLFQLGRIAGYSTLGAVAASTMQGVGWLSTQSAVFRPVWTLLHLFAFLVGLNPRMRSHNQGPTVNTTALPKANKAITPAPSKGLLLNAATSKAP